MKCKEEFLECVEFKVGMGNKLRFWEDKWLLDYPLKTEFSGLYRLSIQKDCYIQEVLNRVNENVVWCLNFVRNLNDWEIADFMRLMGLLQVHNLNFQISDRIRWTLDGSGLFSVKSFASWLVKGRAERDFNHFPEKIWKNSAPKKAQIVCWLACLEKLNTMDMIQRRMPLSYWNPQWCVMCKKGGESVNHIFLHCPTANFLWSKLFNLAGVVGPLPFSCNSFFEHFWFSFGGKVKGKVLWEVARIALFWVLWDERNRRIFQDKSKNSDELWDRVVYLASLWASISKEFIGTSYFFIRNNWGAVIA